MTLLLQKKSRILLVRRDNIGDLVCTTPAIAALRLCYPEAEIAALVNSYNAEVLNGNPNLDKVFVYQKLKHAGGVGGRFQALCRRLRLIAQLRRWKPDVIILAKASYDRHGLNFSRQIGAKNIIGYVPYDLDQAKGLPDIRLETPEFSSLHEVEAVNGLLKPLGITDALGPLEVFPNRKIATQLRHKLPTATRRIALHISARDPERRWGNSNFVALAQHILNVQQETQILLFWSPGKADDPHHPGDDEVVACLIEAVESDRLIPMPTQNLTELIAALSLCELFIGTDGGALHLGVALGLPTVALFENLPAKLNHWYPWKVPHWVLHSPDPTRPNVEHISLAQAIDSVDISYNARIDLL